MVLPNLLSRSLPKRELDTQVHREKSVAAASILLHLGGSKNFFVSGFPGTFSIWGNCKKLGASLPFLPWRESGHSLFQCHSRLQHAHWLGSSFVGCLWLVPQREPGLLFRESLLSSPDDPKPRGRQPEKALLFHLSLFLLFFCHTAVVKVPKGHEHEVGTQDSFILRVLRVHCGV